MEGLSDSIFNGKALPVCHTTCGIAMSNADAFWIDIAAYHTRFMQEVRYQYPGFWGVV